MLRGDGAGKTAESRGLRPAASLPPSSSAESLLERLYAVAQKGDRDALLAALRDVVPAFTPSVVVVADGVTPKRSR